MLRASLLATLVALAACSGGDDAGNEDTGMEHDHDDHGDHDDLDLSTEKMTDGGTYMVAYSTMPGTVPLNEDFMVMVNLSDMDGVPLQATSVSVDATMPEHGHGMNVIPMVMDMGEGMWHADGMRFHMEGYWELAVEVDGELVTFDIDCCDAGDATM